MTKTICCLGAGYVGGPTMAVIARHHPDKRVVVADVDERKVEAWSSDRLPVYEPGLDEVVRECRGRNLFFTTDVDRGIEEAEIIFVSVNTPTKKEGVGKGRASDLRYVEACARRVGRQASGAKIVVEKSTVPVRTAAALEKILEHSSSGATFDVLSNPEFLAEGTAIRDLENPDRVLIGGKRPEAVERLVDIYAAWVPREKIITMNLWSAELSKLAANAFLAQRISSINAISALCEKTGADVNEIAAAIGRDARIGQRFLGASVGFGGSCFQKDLLNLSYLCEHFGLPEAAEYWAQVVKMNQYQTSRFSRKMIETMFNTVSGKRIALWGFAFKKDTNDTRESPAIRVARELLAEDARLAVYDPRVGAERILEELEASFADDSGAVSDAARERVRRNVEIAASPEEAAEDAHAVAILTEWDEFRTLDYRAVYQRMTRPAFLFDGRNVVDRDAVRAIGFEAHCVGRG